MNIVRFEILDSTNAEALRVDYPEGTIIVADCQTEGRGQRGNVWVSEKSKNLTFSLVHYPNIPLGDSFRISMAAALSVVDALQCCGISPKIKWPNDIYVGDRKIAGILIENSIIGGSIIRKSVIGIGLNVGQKEFPSGIPNPTSMALCGVDVSSDHVLGLFRFPLYESVQSLYSRYMDRMWRKEGYYPYCDADGDFSAKITDLDINTGRLSLERENGTISRYYFKEVSAVL